MAVNREWDGAFDCWSTVALNLQRPGTGLFLVINGDSGKTEPEFFQGQYKLYKLSAQICELTHLKFIVKSV